MPTDVQTDAARVRRLALALPGAVESAHMGHADFRLGDRIFATLAYVAKGQATLKLTLEQQQLFVTEQPEIFECAPGGWGRMGMTLIRIAEADDDVLAGALHTAYRNIADKMKNAARPRRTHRPTIE